MYPRLGTTGLQYYPFGGMHDDRARTWCMIECQHKTPCSSIHAACVGIHTMEMITKVNYWGIRNRLHEIVWILKARWAGAWQNVDYTNCCLSWDTLHHLCTCQTPVLHTKNREELREGLLSHVPVRKRTQKCLMSSWNLILHPALQGLDGHK